MLVATVNRFVIDRGVLRAIKSPRSAKALTVAASTVNRFVIDRGVLRAIKSPRSAKALTVATSFRYCQEPGKL